MATRQRWGLTIPLAGITLAEHREVMQEAERLGYTDAWTGEADISDAFVPLAMTAAWTERMRLGTGIAGVFTRGPALLALTAATMAQGAPGRFVLGLGASSDVIVRDWNGIAYDRPLARTRDVVALAREALTGARVSRTLETASMRGFRLFGGMSAPVPVYVAAQREGMLRLAGEVADGVMLNWLTPDNASRSVAIVREAARVAGRDPAALEVVCRIFVIMDEDEELARTAARRLIAGYLNVPVYRAYHRWAGNERLFGAMWQKWDAGDRRGAVDAIPDEAVDALFGTGDAARCHAFVGRYLTNGVDTPVLAFIPPRALLDPGTDPSVLARQSLAMLRALAP
jgi:probable F420-dependent oxidoreductase